MSLMVSKDEAPEMHVQRLVHSVDYRYRIHWKDLLGKADIVFNPKKNIELRGRLALPPSL